MEKGLSDRFLLLLEMAKPSDLATPRTPEYDRWQNIKRGRARVGADEIEAISNLFPAYRWWLLTGEVRPEMGQTSPAYDEANQSLDAPAAG